MAEVTYAKNRIGGDRSIDSALACSLDLLNERPCSVWAIGCLCRYACRLIDGFPQIIELHLPGPSKSVPGSHEERVMRAIDEMALAGSIAPLINGYNDPNQIRYDEKRFWRFVAAWNPSVIACGTSQFSMTTCYGEVTVQTGLSDFGGRFHYEQCIAFLKLRTARLRSETVFLLRDRKVGRRTLHLPSHGPWEHDLAEVISVLVMRRK